MHTLSIRYIVYIYRYRSKAKEQPQQNKDISTNISKNKIDRHEK